MTVKPFARPIPRHSPSFTSASGFATRHAQRTGHATSYRVVGWRERRIRDADAIIVRVLDFRISPRAAHPEQQELLTHRLRPRPEPRRSRRAHAPATLTPSPTTSRAHAASSPKSSNAAAPLSASQRNQPAAVPQSARDPQPKTSPTIASGRIAATRRHTTPRQKRQRQQPHRRTARSSRAAQGRLRHPSHLRALLARPRAHPRPRIRSQGEPPALRKAKTIKIHR